MSTPFGPQLIGETEKSLNALLRRFLDGTGLTEPQWVTLRLAGLLEGDVDAQGLATAVAQRAQYPDAVDLVSQLTSRGLLHDGRLTEAGQDVIAAVRATIDTETAPIWRDLPPDDVAAATRVLNEVVHRARAVLTGGGTRSAGSNARDGARGTP